MYEISSSEFATDCCEAPWLSKGEYSDADFASRHPLRILIAEDNYINRKLLLAMLESLGYDAVACDNGCESYTVALLGDFDVFLNDLNMVELDGATCSLKLREAGVPLTIVAMTASSPELTRNQCIDAGMEGYLQKPVSLDDLKRTLAAVHATRERHDMLMMAAA